MGQSTAIPLAEALQLLLPRPEQTGLLRACLYSGHSVATAWESWLAAVSNAKQFLSVPVSEAAVGEAQTASLPV